MAGLLDDLYLGLPTPAQNLTLHIKGLHERRIRFGKHYRLYAREVAARRYWSRQQFTEFQLDALKHLVADAALHVPFYRDLYAQSSYKDVTITSLDDLTKLPIIDKATLRDRNPDFRDSRLAGHAPIHIKTTGTTGTPVTVFTTRCARQLNYAYYNDFLTAVGLNPFARRTVLGGRVIMAAGRRRGPYWRFSKSLNTMYLSSYHISHTTVLSYAEAINDWDAEYIDAYPSSLCILAELLRESRLTVRSPRALITSSESLHPEQRELIESVFGAPIYDQYGAREMCMFVAQCKSGRYHVRPDYGIMEIYKDGRHTRPGEIGQVLCTGFINPAMPLIRYNIGDMAAWAVDQKCDCGSAGPVLQQIAGREGDAIICPDGRRIGRLSPLLKGFPVREAQYVQRELGVVIVRLVKEQGYTQRDTEAIRAQLRKRLGDTLTFEFEFVDVIPRGRGGKFRAIISELEDRSYDPADSA